LFRRLLVEKGLICLVPQRHEDVAGVGNSNRSIDQRNEQRSGSQALSGPIGQCII
jgi:hypothetical protein